MPEQVRESNPTIVYIMGPGRSGTTILEILLENSPGITGVGELTHLFQDGFVDDAECSCGRDLDTCELWGEVKQKMALSLSDSKKAVQLFRNLDWHSGLVKALRRSQNEDEWSHYSEINHKLFAAIEQVTDANFIVDSSKYSARALNLHRLYPQQVKVLCVLRSPEGLMHSFLKPNKEEQRPKSLVNILVYYYLVCFSLRLSISKFKQDVLLIRYEDMIESPLKVLSSIENHLDVDLSVSKKKIENKAVLDVGHIVTGNRLRKSKNLTFKQGKATEIQPNIQQRVILKLMHLGAAILGLNKL